MKDNQEYPRTIDIRLCHNMGPVVTDFCDFATLSTLTDIGQWFNPGSCQVHVSFLTLILLSTHEQATFQFESCHHPSLLPPSAPLPLSPSLHARDATDFELSEMGTQLDPNPTYSQVKGLGY